MEDEGDDLFIFNILFGKPSENFHLSFEEYREKTFAIMILWCI